MDRQRCDPRIERRVGLRPRPPARGRGDWPNVRWPAALFARRAWALSIPILSHIIKEKFEERVQSVSMQIDDKKARITSFAPIRGGNDPVILTAGVLILSGGFWYLVNWILQDGLSSLIGY